MPAAVSRLCETSRLFSLGRGTVARVMVSVYQSPLASRVRANGFESVAEKGENNGKVFKLLCDKFRVERLGRAQKSLGRVLSSLWERSSEVSAVRSAKESGSDVSLLL